VKIHILDDIFDTLRGLPSFAKLAGHEVTAWNDPRREPRGLGTEDGVSAIAKDVRARSRS
jgi:D-3-phosphoglycerate dehydrogenase